MSQLTPLPITPPGGCVATESMRVAEGRWVLPFDGVRFVRGRPQKKGGWSLAFAAPTSGNPRSLHAWTDQTVNRYLAVGTYRKLYVYDPSGVQNDITPFRLTSPANGSIGGGVALTNPFTTNTTAGTQSRIAVAHAGHGLSIGDTIIYTSVGANVGGITSGQLTGTFAVLSVTDVNNYVFDCGVNASSIATGGGTVQYEYEITIGSELGAFGLGWGVGGWGLGTWGTARASSTIIIEPRVWSMDHFGKILVGTYNTGTIYQFDPTQSQPWPRALAVTGSPPANARSLVVTPERFVFALCEGMVVASCSQGDFNTWTPAVNNTAFSRTLNKGTKLIAGRVLMDFVTLVWSDAAVFRFQYTGSQFVYNSSMIAEDCGLIAPNALACVNGVAYWMGNSNFWMFDGSVHPMPNVEDIRKYVFDQLNTNNGYQCAAVYNPTYNEIEFHITITGQTEPTITVTYGINEGTWWPGTSTRVGGTHFTSGDNRPFMGDTSGFIYQHENGFDAAGSPITWTMTLAPYAMQQGYYNLLVQHFLFDTFQQSGNITLTFNAYDRVGDTIADSTPIDTQANVVASSPPALIDVGITGRYLGFSATSSDLGGYFRLGKPVAFTKPMGVRP